MSERAATIWRAYPRVREGGGLLRDSIAAATTRPSTFLAHPHHDSCMGYVLKDGRCLGSLFTCWLFIMVQGINASVCRGHGLLCMRPCRRNAAHTTTTIILKGPHEWRMERGESAHVSGRRCLLARSPDYECYWGGALLTTSYCIHGVRVPGSRMENAHAGRRSMVHDHECHHGMVDPKSVYWTYL